MNSKSIIRTIISNPIVQTLAVYISGSWVIIELIEYMILHFNLSERFRFVFLVALLCGLPIALFIAWYISKEKGEPDKIHSEINKELISTTEREKGSKIRKGITKPGIYLSGTILILLLLVFGIRYVSFKARIKWATETALPEIEKYLDMEDYPSAFRLLQKVEKYIPEDSILIEYASNAVTTLTILTDPPGADVSVRVYTDTSGEWHGLGKTPIVSLKLPAFTIYRMRLEKVNYEPVLAVVSTDFDTVSRTLFKEGKTPPGMVYVEGYSYEWPNYRFQEKLGFFMDRYEVTNRQYKDFIDQGGYGIPDYWNYEFIRNEKSLTWDEAMAYFTDRSGRPGPSAWEASDYPDGQDNHPVSGISWYEAAAYAEFAGKSLPTSWHWASAAGAFIDPNIRNNYYSSIVPWSNFHGKGTEPVGINPAVNMFGAYDMAGNVREWCFNATQAGRITCGGAWNDTEYMYNNPSQVPPFDRSDRNGFRCVQYLDREKIKESVFQEIEFWERTDYSKFEAVPDEIFAIYKNQFLYDRAELNASVDKKDVSWDDWSMETVSFNAAYGNDRVTAYLYLPKNTPPPYQTVIYFPGMGAVYAKNDFGISSWTIWFIDYFMKNGRAVILPVYKGTSFRNEGLTGYMSNVNRSHEFTEWLIAWTKDLSRSIDYLETRSDIDTSKLAFLGWSWGGEIGAVIPAVEKRIKANMLIVGGFTGTAYPEADPVNYLSRIKTPVLMLNGKYDIWRPYETNIKPFFELLGTPEKDKILILYETDHYVPKRDMIKENLAFLDKYFGPVK